MVMKLLRRAAGSWTLERKSMLFFGTTLLVSVIARDGSCITSLEDW